MTERNKAGQALFQIEFMSFMLSCGREEEASEAYSKAHALLTELEQAMNDEQSAKKDAP